MHAPDDANIVLKFLLLLLIRALLCSDCNLPFRKEAAQSFGILPKKVSPTVLYGSRLNHHNYQITIERYAEVFSKQRYTCMLIQVDRELLKPAFKKRG